MGRLKSLQMEKHRYRQLLISLLFTTGLAVAIFLIWRKVEGPSDKNILSFIRSADRVELSFTKIGDTVPQDRWGEQKISLVNQKDVQQFANSVTLKHKEPSKCEHLKFIYFFNNDQSLKVAICSACFDVWKYSDGRKVSKYYEMPPETWELFCKYQQDYEK